MTRITVIRIVACATLSFGAGNVLAFDGSPPVSRTGAPAIGARPAESSCTACHGGNPLNTGGLIELTGLPSAYVSGAVYDLTVRVSSSQTSANTGRLWGFELTAVDGLTGNGTGTLANIAGQGTGTAPGSGNFSTRNYIRFSSNNHAGTDSPVEWQIRWTAPDLAPGPVHFFFSGMAADGANGEGGDWTYTGTAVIDPASVGVQNSTWSAVKMLFEG